VRPPKCELGFPPAARTRPKQQVQCVDSHMNLAAPLALITRHECSAQRTTARSDSGRRRNTQVRHLRMQSDHVLPILCILNYPDFSSYWLHFYFKASYTTCLVCKGGTSNVLNFYLATFLTWRPSDQKPLQRASLITLLRLYVLCYQFTPFQKGTS